jgi:hypothetical protein
MSLVKIQIIAGKDYTVANKVLVDNKLAYDFGHSAAVETERLKKLIDLLDIEVEFTDKEKV